MPTNVTTSAMKVSSGTYKHTKPTSQTVRHIHSFIHSSMREMATMNRRQTTS